VISSALPQRKLKGIFSRGVRDGDKDGGRKILSFFSLCRRDRKHPRERSHEPRNLFSVLNAVIRKRKYLCAPTRAYVRVCACACGNVLIRDIEETSIKMHASPQKCNQLRVSSTKLTAPAVCCVADLMKLALPGAETGRSLAVQLAAQLALQGEKEVSRVGKLRRHPRDLLGCMRSIRGTASATVSDDTGSLARTLSPRMLTSRCSFVDFWFCL
jgi:hypothetical protein